MATGLVARFGAGVLDGALLVAGELHRPEFERQLVELAVEAEWNLIVVVVDWRARVDPDIESLHR